ncbi:amidohydrolase family protein [Demequina zhanjiangensis]|uniref:Amidohydrolase family protein n=1 Tax=Demequina zhanjiangensis TaxID=3051659 RepID=A0ABT8G4F5_9MICO|nr:amidohydrolase family protein [Demequina sp. SYSU T00b26]MDN4473988.1 amidohydrolase family protein [Demequina sp. SYSU T00b26]
MPSRATSVLRNATLRDGSVCDIVLDDAVVAAVLPAGEGVADTVVDLEGRLLLTAGADAHAHLDKAYTWDAINPPFGDLLGAIEAFHDFQENLTEDDIYARARRAALALLANGTTAVRSHVNLLPGDQPFRGVDAMVRLKADLADVMDLQLVALPPVDMDDATIEQALDRGLDLVGGAPHLADDALEDVRRLLALAERRGIGADLHTDESLDGPITITEFARIAGAWPEDRIRTAGHCVRLGTLSPEELAPIVEAVAEARLGVVSLPITNLYLQGWEHEHSTPRGLTALRPLLDGGALVSAGADNVRDPFNPIGRSDALETAALLVTAGHLSLDESWDLCSSAGRAVMGLPVADAVPGAAAEFVAVASANVGEAIAEAPADRIVIHRGRVVARTSVTQQIHLPTPHTTAEGVAHV